MRRLAIRLLLVGLCIVALLDPRPLRARAPLAAVAVIDVSRSMGPTRARVPANVRVVPERWLVGADFRTVGAGAEGASLDRSATNLGAALRDVVARHPGRDIVLTTDARATDEDARAAARAVAGAGGRLFVVVPESAAADVGLRSARLAQSGEEVQVEVTVSASVAGPAQVHLVRDGAIRDRAAVRCSPGATGRVTLRDDVPPGDGSATYRVQLIPDEGTPNDDPGNDTLDVVFQRPRRRALLWGDLDPGALSASIDVSVVDRMRTSDLVGPDVVVLSNIPMAELRPFENALLRFVASGGCLLVLGGPDAYAAGGWSGSSFEQSLLPLHVRVPEGDGLALLLALDRSGSTADASLGWLRDAALQTVRGIVPGERVGVLPFAATPATSLLAPGFVRAGDTEGHATLRRSLEGLRAGGDTSIPAAIEAAAMWLRQESARVRRVVLLTDGDPDKALDPQRLERARTALVRSDVEFGAVVVRMRAAVPQLRALAQRPEDVIFLRDAARIPDALAHAVATERGRQERIERPPAPTLPEGSDLASLAGLSMTWMHDLVTPDSSRVLATAGTARAPLAAVRTVGAGRVVALAWGPEVEPAGRPRGRATARLGAVVEVLAGQADRGLAADFDGEDLVVQGPAGHGRIELRGRDPDGTARTRGRLTESRPGLYRMREPTGAPASGWWVRLPDGVRALRLPARPDPESRGSGLDRVRMEALAQAGGGQVLGAMSEWSPPRPPPGVSLAPWLLLLATILFVVDRFGMRRAA